MLKTRLHCAYALSSETEGFYAECDKLRSIFSRLNYPRSLIESAVSKFSFRYLSGPSANVAKRIKSTIRISLPFKDQVSANAVRRHLCDLSYKIGPTVQPAFVSRKLEQDFRPKQVQPSVVNQRSVASRLKLHTSNIRVTYEYIRVTYEYTRVHILDVLLCSIAEYFY